MGIFRHFNRLMGLGPDYDGDDSHVSTAWRKEQLRYLDTRGVDLPTWRTPKEIAQMRRAERRAALRLAKGA